MILQFSSRRQILRKAPGRSILRREERTDQMSLRENEQRKSQRAQRALDGPLSVSHDDQVLTFFEWCKLNRISERTGRRILNGSDGPVVTMLTSRRKRS